MAEGNSRLGVESVSIRAAVTQRIRHVPHAPEIGLHTACFGEDTDNSTHLSGFLLAVAAAVSRASTASSRF
jgi:hypothetical protein